MTVADVLDRLAAWAEDEGLAALTDDALPYRLVDRMVMDLVAARQADLDNLSWLEDAMNAAARERGYTEARQAVLAGGLPAVRAMIARAREEASGGH